MREKPILFSAPMVRALLAGTKTQTRRAVKNPERYERIHDCAFLCPYGQPGDRLVVRETWQYADWTDDGYPFIRYRADDAQRCIDSGIPEEWTARLTNTWANLSIPANFDIDKRAADQKWRPAIHMPRWASRITLEVTRVRVERLQDISNADCIAEGAPGGHGAIADYAYNATPREHYMHIWTTIHGAASWAANPWLWVIEFRRITP